MLGKEYCKVDTNGRFKFPIALKRQLETGDNRFVLRPSIFANCLELWPYAAFDVEMESLKRRLNPYSIEARRLLRKLSEISVVELDANDRILIPNEQRDCVRNSRELVLQPLDQFIEVWDKELYCRRDEGDANYADLADRLLGHAQEAATPREG